MAKKSIEFELPYYISNNGDGSASVNFTSTLAEAEKADEELEEGWGECCASTVSLKVEGGKLFMRTFERVDGKYGYVWKEIQGKA